MTERNWGEPQIPCHCQDGQLDMIPMHEGKMYRVVGNKVIEATQDEEDSSL